MSGRKRTSWLWLCGPLILALPATAWANRVETFLGWSADGGVYAFETENDETAQSDVIVCWSDPQATAGAWPAGLDRPEAGQQCSGGVCDDDGECADTDKRLAAVKKLVRLPHSTRKGPHGARLSIRKDKSRQRVVLTTSGKQHVIATVESDDSLISGRGVAPHALRIRNAFWRRDGNAVAAEVVGHGSRIYVATLSGKPAAGATATGSWGEDFAGLRVVADAKVAGGPSARRARALLRKLAGQHDKNCDPHDAKQGRILTLDAEIMSDAGTQTVLASLGDGLAIFDARGALVASTGDNFGCTYGGSSQDMLQRVSIAQVVPDAEPEVVVQYSNGGRTEWTGSVQVLKRRGKTLVTIFAAILSERRDGNQSSGTLTIDGNSAIRYEAPGGQPKIFTWSPSKFRFSR
jgi:hypothetical protein